MGLFLEFCFGIQQVLLIGTHRKMKFHAKVGTSFLSFEYSFGKFVFLLNFLTL